MWAIHKYEKALIHIDCLVLPDASDQELLLIICMQFYYEVIDLDP